MPIYEYACPRCKRVMTFLVRNTAAHQTPSCPHCGKVKLRRALSRFAAQTGRKSAGRRAAANPAPGAETPAGAPPDGASADGGETPPDLSFLDGLDENDPRSMGRAMRQMAAQAGEPLDAEMDEVVRRLEAGEDPDKIEEKMGDTLGGGETGGADDQLYDG